MGLTWRSRKTMNVSFLLKQYFSGKDDVSIDVFDAHTLNDVYQNVLKNNMYGN